MSIASEILRIQQAKQAIKESINNKGGTLTNESIDNYAQAIDNLPSGGGGMLMKIMQERFIWLWVSQISLRQVGTLLIVDPLQISQELVPLSLPKELHNTQYHKSTKAIIPQGVTGIGHSFRLDFK